MSIINGLARNREIYRQIFGPGDHEQERRRDLSDAALPDLVCPPMIESAGPAAFPLYPADDSLIAFTAADDISESGYSLGTVSAIEAEAAAEALITRLGEQSRLSPQNMEKE